MSGDLRQVYLNPAEKDPVKQNSVTRQLLENAADQQVLTPEMFGAVGDDATDNTTAFKNIATYLNTSGNGSGVLRFKPGAIYRVWNVAPANQDILIYLNANTLNGFTFDFQGAIIKTTTDWGGATVSYVFFIDDGANNVTFNNPRFLSTHFMGLSDPTANYGPHFLYMRSTTTIDTTNIEINNAIIEGALSGIIATRSAGVTGRIRNIRVTNCQTEKVFYPYNFQKNGDSVLIRNSWNTNSGRVYFPYNVYDHDVELLSDGHAVVVPTIDCTVNVNPAESAFYNTTAHINVKYTVIPFQNLDHAALAGFVMQQETTSPGTGYMRDIKFDIDVSLPSSVVQLSDLIATERSADAASSVFHFENITVTGKLDANGNFVRFADFFSSTAWVGDTVRNIIFRDIQVEGQDSVSAIEVNASCLPSGGMAFLNVNASSSTTGPAGEINISNDAPNRIYVNNVRSSNGYLDDKNLTVATLPTAGISGRKRYVTNANSSTFFTVAAAATTTTTQSAVPVFDDGTNWRIG